MHGYSTYICTFFFVLYSGKQKLFLRIKLLLSITLEYRRRTKCSFLNHKPIQQKNTTVREWINKLLTKNKFHRKGVTYFCSLLYIITCHILLCLCVTIPEWNSLQAARNTAKLWNQNKIMYTASRHHASKHHTHLHKNGTGMDGVLLSSALLICMLSVFGCESLFT